MRSLIGLTFAIALAGCATGTNGVPTTTQISETAKQIQTYTRTICSFVPTIATIVGIINAGAGQSLGIANDICAAVTTAPLADGPNPDKRNVASVGNVVISGRFVR